VLDVRRAAAKFLFMVVVIAWRAVPLGQLLNFFSAGGGAFWFGGWLGEAF